MEMCYQGTLAMPKSYAVMDQDEMMYVEGGWYIPRGFAAAAIDVVILRFCPLLAPFKYAGKAAARKICTKYASYISQRIKGLAQWALGISINASSGFIANAIINNIWCATSLGGMISIVFDCRDGKVDGRISF